MQAIQTYYVTTSRICATCQRASLTFYPPECLEAEKAHIWAVDQLVKFFVAQDADRHGAPTATNPWAGARVCGQLPDGSYAHVFLTREGDR